MSGDKNGGEYTGSYRTDLSFVTRNLEHPVHDKYYNSLEFSFISLSLFKFQYHD